MAYFVTGGTGFIGRFLIGNLLKRGDPIYVLVRKSSQKKLAGLRKELGANEAQVIAVVGDLGKPLNWRIHLLPSLSCHPLHVGSEQRNQYRGGAIRHGDNLIDPG